MRSRKPLWATLPFLREGWRAAEAERAARLAAEAASERLALLADVTKALTSSFELDVMLSDLARLITPRVADAFFIDLVEADGSIRPGASAVRPGYEEWAEQLHDTERLAAHEDHTAAQALRSGTPQVVDEPDCAGVFVPLTGRQGTLGVLSLLTRKGERPEPPSVKLAEELARRASIAVSRACCPSGCLTSRG
jgi:GAF domain-containing protein